MINMFTKEQLQGILISLPKPEVHISKDTRLKGPEYDAGDDFFKRTIRNLFESMEGKEF